MNNKLLVLKSLKVIFFAKIESNLFLRTVDCVKLASKMSTQDCVEPSNFSKLLCPPAGVKGMTEFNKEAFTKEITFPALLVEYAVIRAVKKILSKNIVKLLEMRPVIEVSDKFVHKPGDSKIFLLNPDSISTFDSFEEPVRNELNIYGVTHKNFFYKKVTITFENWRSDDLVSAILPDGLRFTGYTLVGHIAHLNLRQDLLKYKYVLGMIILNKIKVVRTVVNKLDIIDNTYRNFKMEVICGDNELVTTLKENSCTFQLDFSSVYWNSRLSSEHERIVIKINSSDVVYDVFAGIGPFAIPAAKKGCTVLANDLNPESVKWLRKNIILNKITNERIQVFNKDGRDFIIQDIKRHLLTSSEVYGKTSTSVHIIMNLPAIAVTFLEHFKSMFTPEEYKKVPKNINLYVYCFVKDTTTKDSEVLKNHAKNLIVSHLGDKSLACIREVFEVRHVSVNKDMFRVTLSLGPEILVRGTVKRTADMMESDDYQSKDSPAATFAISDSNFESTDVTIEKHNQVID